MIRGTSRQAFVSACAMARRTPRSGTTSRGAPPGAGARGTAGGPGAAGPAAAASAAAGRAAAASGAAARSTSSRRMRPWGPLPSTSSRATPSSRARRRVAGAASGGPEARAAPGAAGTRAPAGGTAAAGGAAGRARAEPGRPLPAAAVGSSTTSGAPTSTLSPSAAHSRVTTPVAGDGRTTIALSVWTSTRSWCSLTWSPTATRQATTSAVAIPSPTSGSRNSTGATSGLQRRADARQHAVDRRDVEVLDRAGRVGGVGCRDAPDRRPERPERLLLDRRDELRPEPGAERGLVDDERPPGVRHRRAQGVHVERHEAAQVEHADGEALGRRALRRLLGDHDGGAVGDDRQVVALADDPRPARGDGEVLLGHLVLDQAVATQRLAEQDRVRVADGVGEHALGVACGGGHEHLEPGRPDVLRLVGIGVQFRGAHVAAERRADDHRHPEAALRAEPHPGHLAFDLVEGLAAEAQELQLGDGHEAAAGQADRRPDDGRLRERHVYDPVRAEARLQAVRGAEDAAVDADVLAEQDDALVALELGGQRRPDR